MNCHWTEKVSLLIDGELAQAEAAEVERHLQTCAACRQARADFLSFRQHLVSYRAEIDPLTQKAALAQILASGAHAARPKGTMASGLQPVAHGWRERFARLTGARALSPAWMAASVLLVFAVVAALLFLFNSRRDATRLAVSPSNNHAPADAQRGDRLANDNRSTEERIAGAREETSASRREGNGQAATSDSHVGVAGRVARSRRNVSPNIERVRGEVARAARGETPRRLQETPAATGLELRVGVELPSMGGGGASVALRRQERAFPASADFKTARHVEQAELLLRSFRNVRMADGGNALDIAYEKESSRKLLYRNIVLRREAASKGDLPVEKVLNSLEPILIDIANLPDRPARDDVRAIKDRMQRKNIVAMLQISAPRAE